MKVHEQLAALTGGKKKKSKKVLEIDTNDPLFMPSVNAVALLSKKKPKKKASKSTPDVVSISQKKPKTISKPSTPVAAPKKSSK